VVAENDVRVVALAGEVVAQKVVEEAPAIENIHGKQVLYRDVKTVLNMKSDFIHKLLCTGPVLNLGDACVFSCVYCYVASIVRKFIVDVLGTHAHQDVVVRRRKALEVLKGQLARCKEKEVSHVVYSSSLVDIAATMELLRETAAACIMILEETAWDIRLLTKSSFLPKLVQRIPEKHHKRLILGVSTGTFDDEIGKVIEKGAALVSKRIESLHWLQDHGFRTFAMVCPSLPQDDYHAFAEQARERLRYDRCEHVWAEVINLRGESFTQTIAALNEAGLIDERDKLALVCGEGAEDRWEAYARATFEAHAEAVGPEKLRFLQYVERKENIEYWTAQKARGAVLLGRYGDKVELSPMPVVEGTGEIRSLLEINHSIEFRLRRKSLTMLSSWIENGIRIGEFFTAQKAKLDHGKYLTWLYSTFKIDRKTASNYAAVYTQRERVREALKCGTIPHLRAAYSLAHKANRLLKGPVRVQVQPAADTAKQVQAQPQLLLMDKPVEESGIAGVDSDGAKVTAPAFDIVKDQELPVLVLEAPEELIAKVLDVVKHHEGRFQHQIIREDGQIRLNDYFAERLALKAA